MIVYGAIHTTREITEDFSTEVLGVFLTPHLIAEKLGVRPLLTGAALVEIITSVYEYLLPSSSGQGLLSIHALEVANLQRHEPQDNMANDRSVAELNISDGQKKRPEQGSSDEQDTADTVETQIRAATTESSVKAEELLNRVLQFLSTASNETLGACLAGLGAITYFILGRVGLVLIGIVGGIVLHAAWEEKAAQLEDQDQSAKERARNRREDGRDILRRVLDWRGARHDNESNVNEGADEVGVKSATYKQLDFSELEPATGAALSGLTDAVIRDYVKYTFLKLFLDLY